MKEIFEQNGLVIMVTVVNQIISSWNLFLDGRQN